MSTARSTGRRVHPAPIVVGTFGLLQATLALLAARCRRTAASASASSTSRPTKSTARSGETGLFTETTPYAPNSPYSASKAASDHLVRAWHHTYGLPALSPIARNNYGPYHFPEKLIPLIDPQRAARQAAAGLRRRRQHPRLAVRRGSRRGASLVRRNGRAPARPTTSAAPASGATSTSSTAICDLVDELAPSAAGPRRETDRHSSPTGRVTISVTPSTPARSNASSAGGRGRLREGPARDGRMVFVQPRHGGGRSARECLRRRAARPWRLAKSALSRASWIDRAPRMFRSD